MTAADTNLSLIAQWGGLDPDTAVIAPEAVEDDYSRRMEALGAKMGRAGWRLAGGVPRGWLAVVEAVGDVVVRLTSDGYIAFRAAGSGGQGEYGTVLLRLAGDGGLAIHISGGTPFLSAISDYLRAVEAWAGRATAGRCAVTGEAGEAVDLGDGRLALKSGLDPAEAWQKAFPRT